MRDGLDGVVRLVGGGQVDGQVGGEDMGLELSGVCTVLDQSRNLE